MRVGIPAPALGSAPRALGRSPSPMSMPPVPKKEEKQGPKKTKKAKKKKKRPKKITPPNFNNPGGTWLVWFAACNLPRISGVENAGCAPAAGHERKPKDFSCRMGELQGLEFAKRPP